MIYNYLYECQGCLTLKSLPDNNDEVYFYCKVCNSGEFHKRLTLVKKKYTGDPSESEVVIMEDEENDNTGES